MHPTGLNPSGLPNAEPSLRGYAYDRATDASEMCWGSGLVPNGLEDAPPACGGRYRATSPPPEERVGMSRDTRG